MKRVPFIYGELVREYLFFSPPTPCGLVVFLPGRGGTAAWADSETGWSQLAIREEFALAIPEGLPPNPLQPSKFLTNPPGWNDGSESPPLPNEPKALATGILLPPNELATGTLPNESEALATSTIFGVPDDVGFLIAVLDDVATRLGSDPRPVFMAGFSNGAGMTFRFAAEQANRVAAIAPVAGHCWVAEPKPVQPVPTLYVVGTADPLIPVRGGDVRNPWTHRLIHRSPVSDTLERWARAIGCSDIPVAESYRGGVRMDSYLGPVPYQSVLIDGLGHHWPGGQGQLNPRIAGPPSDAVNGTELVWKFFKQFV